MADLVYRRVRVAKKPVKDLVSVLIESVIVIVTMCCLLYTSDAADE